MARRPALTLGGIAPPAHHHACHGHALPFASLGCILGAGHDETDRAGKPGKVLCRLAAGKIRTRIAFTVWLQVLMPRD